MIRYEKLNGVDETSIHLLKKLGAEFPLRSLLLDIENHLLTINKVFYDEKLYGILVLRGERNRRGEMVLVVCHAIAEDDIAEHFNAILAESLKDHAAKGKFDIIRIHTNVDALSRIVSRWMGKPKEQVFSIEVNDGYAKRIEYNTADIKHNVR